MDIIHLAKLLVSLSVVGPGLGHIFHPLVAMLTLGVVFLSATYKRIKNEVHNTASIAISGTQ